MISLGFSVSILIMSPSILAQMNELSEQVLKDTRGLLPARAILLKQMQVNFKKGIPDTVLLYEMTNTPKADLDEIGIKVAKYTARCCPNRPSLKMAFKFTGSSIGTESVEELPYGDNVPNLGPHGPLLRTNVGEFWSYGFQLPDGFLVLAGSEGPMSRSEHLSSSAAKLRQRLLGNGVLFDAGSYLRLTQNQKFPSMAIATEVMMGGLLV